MICNQYLKKNRITLYYGLINVELKPNFVKYVLINASSIINYVQTAL